LVCASLVLLARSFYVIYAKKTATRVTTIVAWCSLTFMAGYWTWYGLLGGQGYLMEAMSGSGTTDLPTEERPEAETETDDRTPTAKNTLPTGPQKITLHVPEMRKRGGREGAELT
jgi:hypothetical protein